MLEAIIEVAGTFALLVGICIFMAIVVMILDRVQKFHREGMARVRKYEAREGARK